VREKKFGGPPLPWGVDFWGVYLEKKRKVLRIAWNGEKIDPEKKCHQTFALKNFR
jgi:hypothetical protein